MVSPPRPSDSRLYPAPQKRYNTTMTDYQEYCRESQKYWDSARKMFDDVFMYRHGICYLCNTDLPVNPGEIVVHHIDENPKNNNIENLSVVHKSCHLRYHRNENKRSSVLYIKPYIPGGKPRKRYATSMGRNLCS